MARRRPPVGPPGPAGDRWTGNLAAYEADRLGFLLQTRERFGDLVAFDARTCVVHGPGLAAQLLRDRTGAVEIDENFLQQRLSQAAADEIFHRRSLLNPGLRPTAVLDVAPRVARLTAEHLGPALEEGRELDPLTLCERVISAAVAEHFFGPEGADLPAPTGHLLDALAEVIGNPWALPAWFPTPARHRIRVRHLVLRAHVGELLERRRREPASYDDLAGEVVANSPHDLPLEQVADLLIGSLLAAQRVPAAAAAWVLKLVAEHEEWQVRARGDESVARAVVLEALRLYPPTWVIMRRATRRVVLGGHEFPAGHHFLVSPYVLHRDPRVFEHPEEFRPERWTERRSVPEGYLPFGAGRHRCPGLNLATVALVSLLRTVVTVGRVSATGHEVAPDARTTLLPRGLRLRWSSRSRSDCLQLR